MRLPPGGPGGPRAALGATERASLTAPVVDLPGAQDTHAFGARLASVLRAGDLVLLVGPLGAGKTALVQGIGAGLSVRGPVVSPTFVIARVHPGRLPLVHVDAYRLSSLDEVDDLDLDVSTEDAVTVVEWGVGLVEQLADARLEIILERAEDSDQRTAQLIAQGGDWAERVAALLG
jgi:tRNA threonylcarbamoyladenosine biosynthesis protein TsaE